MREGPSGGPGERMPVTRLDLAIGAGLLLAAVAAVVRMWQPGVSNEVDMVIGVYRTFELDQAWHRQLLYPRMGMGLNFGYGGPLFEFYAPLVSYGALVLHWAGLGLLEASKAMLALCALIAGGGAFVYARWLFADRRAGLVAGFALALSPYLLTNTYERGAAAEELALALAPWTLWALHHAVREPGLRWVWASAAVVALLALSHNITALFAIPALYAFLALTTLPKVAARGLARAALAIVFGLALSAFFWAPALAELGYVNTASEILATGKEPLYQLTSLATLVQTSLAADYWGPTRYHLSLWQTVVAVLGAASLVAGRPAKRGLVAILVGMVLALQFLQISESRPFWQTLPLVRFIQFPWRLLGLASFFIALLAGSLFGLRALRGRAGWPMAAAGLALIAVSSLWNLLPDQSPAWPELPSSQVGYDDLYLRGRFGMPMFGDYTPVWSRVDSTELARPYSGPTDPPSPAADVAQIRVVEEGEASIAVAVRAAVPFTLRLHKLYYPGWQVYVAGQRVPTGPGGERGVVAADLPAGEYVAEARFEETPFRLAMDALSLAALAVWGGVAAARWRRTRAFAAGGTMIVVLALLAIRHQGLGEPPRQPVAVTANFQDEIQLLGFHLEQDAWRAGDDVAIQLYWMARSRPTRDYTVFVHITTIDGSKAVAQADGEPILGYAPTSAWAPGELVVDERLVRLEGSVPAGQYRVLVGFYDRETMQNLKVAQGTAVLPGERVAVAEIAVGGK